MDQELVCSPRLSEAEQRDMAESPMSGEVIEAALTAARAALLSLSATLQFSPERFFFHGSTEWVSQSEAALQLAGLSKPVQCSARREGSGMEITSMPLPAEAIWMLSMRRGELRGEQPFVVPQSVLRSDPPLTVLFFVGEEALLLSQESLRDWYANYFIPGLSLSGDHPSAEQHKRGIGWVLRAFGPGVAMPLR